MKNNGQTEESSRDSGALSNPLSFLRSSFFGWDGAVLGGRGGNGFYWSLQSVHTTFSNDLYFNNTRLLSQDNSAHGNGFAVP